MLMLLKNKTYQALGVLVQYHVAPSDEVKLYRASHPVQRVGWLCVIFYCLFESYSMCFHICAYNWK